MDFFAAATPCNPLGRYAQNDNALPFLQVDFSPFCKRLKMTKSLFLIQSQPYYIYTNFSPKTNSQLKNPHPQKFSHQKTRNHKKISPQIITTLLYIQIFLIKPTQLKNFYIMDFSLSAKAQNDKTLVFNPKPTLLYIQIFSKTNSQLKNFYIMDFSLRSK